MQMLRAGHVPAYSISILYFHLRLRIMEFMASATRLADKLNVRRLYLTYGLIFCLYLILIYYTNPSQAILQSLHLDPDVSRWVGLASRLPLVLIWLTALYGYIQFKKYVLAIGDGREAPHLKLIGYGLAVLTIGLPLTYVIGNILLVASQHGLLDAGLRKAISSYPALIMQLAAFGLISRGAYGLVHIVNKQVHFWVVSLYGSASIVVGVVYSFLVASNGVDIVHAATVYNEVFHMPNWLVVVATVLPFLFAWSLGIRAVFDMNRFQSLVNGRLYRRSLIMFTSGLGLVVGSSILAQFIATQSKQGLLTSTVQMFIIAYSLYTVFAIGYVLIAIGARRLRKIEEV